MAFFSTRSDSDIAEFRRKIISNCFKIAAAAPSSGGGAKMMIGRSAMMTSPTLSGSSIATPRSIAH